MSDSRSIPPLPPNGGWYRPITDPSQPFVPSPASSRIDLSPPIDAREAEASPEPSMYRVVWLHPERRRRKCLILRCLQRVLVPRIKLPETVKLVPVKPPTKTFRPRVLSPKDWKAWGYYSRPSVNGQFVRNSAELPVYIDQETLKQIFEKTTFGHPEHWIPGIRHPSLPPRPPHWDPPRPGGPQPFPWECQLNPFLQHTRFGQPPLNFHIDIPPELIALPHQYIVNLLPADFAQPATCPFVTDMYIREVGDDVWGSFPWPFRVTNPRGVRCGDVFQKIYENFQEHVSAVEYAAWPERRRAEADIAFHMRKAQERGWVDLPRLNDVGMRRIDYLGHRVMFRGLEPSPARDGTWTMFVGPSPI